MCRSPEACTASFIFRAQEDSTHSCLPEARDYSGLDVVSPGQAQAADFQGILRASVLDCWDADSPAFEIRHWWAPLLPLLVTRESSLGNAQAFGSAIGTGAVPEILIALSRAGITQAHLLTAWDGMWPHWYSLGVSIIGHPVDHQWLPMLWWLGQCKRQGFKTLICADGAGIVDGRPAPGVSAGRSPIARDAISARARRVGTGARRLIRRTSAPRRRDVQLRREDLGFSLVREDVVLDLDLIGARERIAQRARASDCGIAGILEGQPPPQRLRRLAVRRRLAAHFGIELRYPLLHPEVIRAFLDTPPDQRFASAHGPGLMGPVLAEAGVQEPPSPTALSGYGDLAKTAVVRGRER